MKRGFTLLEILVVVVIIGLLASLVVPHLWVTIEEAQIKIALTKCVQYHDSVKLWRLLRGGAEYPTSLAEMEQPLRSGQENFMRVVQDPWQCDYRLEYDLPRIHICSNGPDRSPNTHDDICYVARVD